MATVSVRVDKELFDEAAVMGRAEYRSAVQQFNFWAKVGKNALANPDLPVEVVRDLLIAKEQPTEPFVFEED